MEDELDGVFPGTTQRSGIVLIYKLWRENVITYFSEYTCANAVC
jgi:hypothetical protein